MLRSDLSELLEEKEKKQIAIEDIENFYRIITQSSYDKSNPFSDTLSLMRKNYFEHIAKHLYKPSLEEKSIDPKCRILISQINMLIEKNFFINKIKLDVINFIKEDLQTNGKLFKSKFAQETREDILSTFQNITDEALAASAMPDKNIPSTLRTGLSSNERYDAFSIHTYHLLSLSDKINNQGVKYFEQREWKEAIECFKNAIVTHDDMNSELKVEKDYASTALYRRNLANAFCNYANAFCNEGQWAEAIEHYKLSISTISAINPKETSKKDAENLADQYRYLALALNNQAQQYYYQDNYEESIKGHRECLVVRSKISSNLLTEDDEEKIAVDMRNLAYVLNSQGYMLKNDNKFASSIEKYREAITLMKQIKDEQKEENDIYLLNTYYRNLAYSLSGTGLFYQNEGNIEKSIEEYNSCVAAVNEIPRENRIEDDWIFLADIREKLIEVLITTKRAPTASINLVSIFKQPDKESKGDKTIDNPASKKRKM